MEGLGVLLRKFVEEAGGVQKRFDGVFDVVDDEALVVHLVDQTERPRIGPAPPGRALPGPLLRPVPPGLGPRHGPERGPGGRGLPAEGVPDAVLLVRAHPAAPRLVVAPGLRRHPGALGHLRHGQPQLLAPGAHRLDDVRVVGLVAVCVARAQDGTSERRGEPRRSSRWTRRRRLPAGAAYRRGRGRVSSGLRRSGGGSRPSGGQFSVAGLRGQPARRGLRAVMSAQISYMLPPSTKILTTTDSLWNKVNHLINRKLDNPDDFPGRPFPAPTSTRGLHGQLQMRRRTLFSGIFDESHRRLDTLLTM